MNDHVRAVLKMRKLGEHAMTLRSLELDGRPLDLPADSPVVLRAGPGPCILTVDLIIAELVIEEDDEQ